MSDHFSNGDKKSLNPLTGYPVKKVHSSFFFGGSPWPTLVILRLLPATQNRSPGGPWPGLKGIDHTKEELQIIEDILPRQKFTSFFGYKQLSETCLWIGIGAFFFWTSGL